jgi:hypothetical protein
MLANLTMPAPLVNESSTGALASSRRIPDYEKGREVPGVVAGKGSPATVRLDLPTGSRTRSAGPPGGILAEEPSPPVATSLQVGARLCRLLRGGSPQRSSIKEFVQSNSLYRTARFILYIDPLGADGLA